MGKEIRVPLSDKEHKIIKAYVEETSDTMGGFLRRAGLLMIGRSEMIDRQAKKSEG